MELTTEDLLVITNVMLIVVTGMDAAKDVHHDNITARQSRDANRTLLRVVRQLTTRRVSAPPRDTPPRRNRRTRH